MARFVHALNSNYVSDVGLGQLTGRVFSEGVLGETDFEVTEKQTGRNMSVDIYPGALIIHNPSGHGHLLYSTEVENVPLAPSDPLNPRKSLIVAVLDVNYTNAAVNDAEGGWEFIEVAGSAAATPAEPDAAAIQSAAGAGNLYQVIQLVDVPADTPDIEDADLTDRRSFSGVTVAPADGLITTPKISNNAVTVDKIANGAVTQPKAPFALSGDEANLLIDSARVNFVPLAASGTRTDTITFSDLSTIKYINVIFLRGSGGNDTAGKIEWTVLNGADSPWEVNPSGNSTQIFWRNPTGTAIYGFAIVWAIGEKA